MCGGLLVDHVGAHFEVAVDALPLLDGLTLELGGDGCLMQR